MEDFDRHLDSARLWWGLDDVVLAAIIEGKATAEPFRRIASYTRSLRSAAGPAPTEDQVNASITKIAIRLAAMPEFSPRRQDDSRRVARLVGRRLAFTALGSVALIGLLVAGDAANILELPKPIRVMLDRIGIGPPDESRTARALEWAGPQIDTGGVVIVAPASTSTDPTAHATRTSPNNLARPRGSEKDKAKEKEDPTTASDPSAEHPQDVEERAPENQSDVGQSRRPTARPEPTTRPQPTPRPEPTRRPDRP